MRECWNHVEAVHIALVISNAVEFFQMSLFRGLSWFAMFVIEVLIWIYFTFGVGTIDLEILTFPKLCVM